MSSHSAEPAPVLQEAVLVCSCGLQLSAGLFPLPATLSSAPSFHPPPPTHLS